LLALVALLLIATAGAGCAGLGTPKTIYLARHGQTSWNRTWRFQGDPDLDPVGYVNRASLYLLLKDRPIQVIYTSERLRTRRTAAPLAQAKGLTIRPRAALNEISPGIFEGMCLAQLMPQRSTTEDQRCLVEARGSRPESTLKRLRKLAQPFVNDSLETRWPMGQSVVDLDAQVRPLIGELRRNPRDAEVLVVGHGVVNRVLLRQLMGWSLQSVAKLRQLNDQVYRIEQAGSDQARLSLYTPGQGWKACAPPATGQQYLDCNPGPPQRTTPTQAPQEPAPAAEDDALPPEPESEPTTEQPGDSD
jgi:broad specificity phosphatase PhoE